MNSRWVFLPICSLALSACAPFDYRTRIDLLGSPAPVSAATRTIFINPAANYVNVTGETIKFVAGENSFAWNFDGAVFAPAFDLQVAAPPSVLVHKVIAYVAPIPCTRAKARAADAGGMAVATARVSTPADVVETPPDLCRSFADPGSAQLCNGGQRRLRRVQT